MGSCLSPFTMAAVNIAIPSLALDLNASATSIAWMPTIFLLVNVALILPFGKVADNVGRKKVYLAGILTSITASLGSYVSPSIEWILFFRGVQGAGSAMIFGTSLALITSVYPSAKRGLPLGLNTASVYIGLTIAPAVGGWLTETFGWRSVLFFPIPIAMMLFTLGTFGIKGEWKKETYSTFDWKGTLLFSSWAITFVTGFTTLQSVNGSLLFFSSFILLGLFILYQSKTPEPLIRIQLFTQNRMLSFSLLAALLMYASNYPLGFLLSLYLQYVRDLSPAQAGQILLAQATAMALLAPFAGKLSDRVEPRILTTGGCLITLAGFLLLTQLSATTNTWLISGALFLIGIGFGIFSSPNHNAVMSTVTNKDLGVASASLNLARTCGNIFAISLANYLIQLFIGDSVITQANHSDLITTVHIAILISILLIISATFVSAKRGRLA